VITITEIWLCAVTWSDSVTGREQGHPDVRDMIEDRMAVSPLKQPR
jgi:hypothetical protein